MDINIEILDTTLRDGLQAPGISMTVAKKVDFANCLFDLGVDGIEAGFAASSEFEQDSIRAIIASIGHQNRPIVSLARALEKDIIQAARVLEGAVRPRIHTFISTSKSHVENQLGLSQGEVLDTIHHSIRCAKQYCDEVQWSAMDASRSDNTFLSACVQAAIEAGATYINIADTLGVWMPEQAKAVFLSLVQMFPDARFSVHCHNDLGFSTANAFSAVLGGARQVECTINGIGERAGNTALEEIVLLLKERKDPRYKTQVHMNKLLSVSRLFSAMTGFHVQKNKAVVGENALKHMSGIHQDGFLKQKSLYESSWAQEVSSTSDKLILGTYSGRQAIRHFLGQNNCFLEREELDRLYKWFKKQSAGSSVLTETELLHQAHRLFPHKVAAPSSLVIESYEYGYDSKKKRHRLSIQMQFKSEIYTGQGEGGSLLEVLKQAFEGICLIPCEILAYDAGFSFYAPYESGQGFMVVRAEQGEYESKSSSSTEFVGALCSAYVECLNKVLRASLKPKEKKQTSTKNFSIYKNPVTT